MDIRVAHRAATDHGESGGRSGRSAHPPDFLGLSFETADILPAKSGKYPFFRPDNGALITLLKTLGVKSLRVGGSSADAADISIPTNADIDELFHFNTTDVGLCASVLLRRDPVMRSRTAFGSRLDRSMR